MEKSCVSRLSAAGLWIIVFLLQLKRSEQAGLPVENLAFHVFGHDDHFELLSTSDASPLGELMKNSAVGSMT